MSQHTKLEEGLAKSQKEVDVWVNTHIKLAEDEVSQHKGFMNGQQDSINMRTQEEKQFKDDAGQLKIALQQEQMELEKLKADIGSLQSQERTLPELLDGEKKRLQAARNATEQKYQEVDSKELELRNLLNESTHGANYFKERLGLDFEKIEDNSLRFCFTKIDPTNPARRFIFSVYVDDNDMYKVLECNPRIDDLVTLVDKLNTTNNFSAFVQSIRKQFKAKCSKK